MAIHDTIVLQNEAIATLDADDADRCNIDDLPDPDKYYGPAGSDDEGEEGSSEDGSDSEEGEGSDSEEGEQESDDEEDGDEEESEDEDRCGCVFITFFYFCVQGSYTSWKIL